jgi:hypothetical protein
MIRTAHRIALCHLRVAQPIEEQILTQVTQPSFPLHSLRSKACVLINRHY